jgi:PiT family inorganic phosphate transporter
MVLLIVLVTAALGLYMAWSIGANDVANSMAAAVGSRSISIRNAIIAAGLCEFAGAVLVGSHVTETIRKGIVSMDALRSLPGMAPAELGALLALGMASALLAAALWLHIATWMGMPVSTTHSIVGAVTGFGIVAAGWSAIHWGKMGQIVASWFISPIAGGILAFVFFRLISRAILGREKPFDAARHYAPVIVFVTATVIALATVYKGLGNIAKNVRWLNGWPAIGISVCIGVVAAAFARLLIARGKARDGAAPLGDQLENVERMFGPLVIATSCCVAFAHGANDVANAVGPLAAVVDIFRSGTIKMQVAVPFWVLVLGGAGIVLGLTTFGRRVMSTVGTKITQITPSRGIAANLATTITVLTCSRLGLPVSTTHTIVGAILGIGMARGLGAVNRQVTRDIFGSWLITVPAAAVLSVILFVVSRAFMLGFLAKVISGSAA